MRWVGLRRVGDQMAALCHTLPFYTLTVDANCGSWMEMGRQTSTWFVWAHYSTVHEVEQREVATYRTCFFIACQQPPFHQYQHLAVEALPANSSI